MLTKIGKGLLGFVVYTATYFIVGAIAFGILYVIRGLYDLKGVFQYLEVISVSVLAAFAGAAAGATLLEKIFNDYPARTIAAGFVVVMLVLIGFGITAQVLYPMDDVFENIIAPTIRCVAAIAGTILFLWKRET